ncbi:hypothetical protein QTV49_000328 [Vibrio vulnificus]|nr:hypothetical protein [Vibrio vulnificus]
MINFEQLNNLKKHLNRSASTIFVIGQGIDYKDDVLWKNDIVKSLYSESIDKVRESWCELLNSGNNPVKVPFISSYTHYVNETALINLASFYILNTSITADIGDCSKNTVTINLNGLLHKGVCKKTGIVKDVKNSCETDRLIPAFVPASENYKPFREVVDELEQFIEKQEVRSIIFLGCSGNCPVVESIYNRALIRSAAKDPVFKCIVNPTETYMDDQADLVIREDAKEFLEYLASTFKDKDAERFFNV